MIEIFTHLCYVKYRKSIHSKAGCLSRKAKMSLQTPPILLADRIGIFISSYAYPDKNFSYRER